MTADVAAGLVPEPTPTTAGDEHLVAAVRRGDDRAFECLYARYQRRIASYVLGMVRDHGRAEDVTQEVFVSALRRMRATERPIAFKPWIYEIARNACIDQFRHQRRHDELPFDTEDGSAEPRTPALAQPDGSPDAVVEVKERLGHLRGALGGLSDAHHQILVMREFEGLSYDEIGRRLGLSRASVESTLFRARKRLLEEHEELVSGRRCLAVQEIIGSAAGATLGRRDHRTMDRHLAHCQPCRRVAALAGVERPGDRRGVAEKIAAVLPLPAFLRRWLAGGGGGAGGHAASLSGWSARAGSALEPLGSWGKAAVAAGVLAAAGAGAGVAASSGGGAVHHAPAIRHLTPAAVAAGAPAVSTPLPAAHRVATPHRRRTHARSSRAGGGAVSTPGGSAISAPISSPQSAGAPVSAAPEQTAARPSATPSRPSAPSLPPSVTPVSQTVQAVAQQTAQTVQDAQQVVQDTVQEAGQVVQGAAQAVKGTVDTVGGAAQRAVGSLTGAPSGG